MKKFRLVTLALLLLGAGICLTSCSKDDNKGGGVNNPQAGNPATGGGGSFSLKVIDNNGKTFTTKRKGEAVIFSQDTIKTSGGETRYSVFYGIITIDHTSKLPDIIINFMANSAISNLQKGQSAENVNIIDDGQGDLMIDMNLFDTEHVYMTENGSVLATEPKIFIKKITYVNDVSMHGIPYGRHYRIEGGKLETTTFLNNNTIQKVELDFDGTSFF